MRKGPSDGGRGPGDQAGAGEGSGGGSPRCTISPRRPPSFRQPLVGPCTCKRVCLLCNCDPHSGQVTHARDRQGQVSLPGREVGNVLHTQPGARPTCGFSSGSGASVSPHLLLPLPLLPLSLEPNHRPIHPFLVFLWGLQAPPGGESSTSRPPSSRTQSPSNATCNAPARHIRLRTNEVSYCSGCIYTVLAVCRAWA